MKKELYRWTWTALITPFKEWDWINNEVDFDALEKILEMQIDWWVTWILLLWTTAETPSLSTEEQLEILNFAIPKINSRVKVMVNVWTNATNKSLKNLELFEKINWIDAYLVVNPYYNKPTQSWMYMHFDVIAKATSKDIFLYNIKWRTAVNLDTETLVKLTENNKNIVWVKEASWDLEQMISVINSTHDDFVVLSGDDSMSYDLIKNWWDWVVSVASNCEPRVISEFISKSLSWTDDASDLNNYYSDFFDKLFIQTNPLPTKVYLSEKWIIKESYRLPICNMDSEKRLEFLDSIKKYNF